MWELLRESILLVNLPYTVLLGLVVLYWILYIAGAASSDLLDSLDMDLDVDADVDAGVDVDADAEYSAENTGGWLSGVSHFLHIDEVPFLFVISILVLMMWTVSMAANHYLGNESGWVALLLLVPNLIVSMLATKAIVAPFLPALRQVFDERGDKTDLVGRRCVVSSLGVTTRHGQAEVATKGAPLVLNVKCREGTSLGRGDEAVICDYDRDKNVYWITKFDSASEEK